VACTQRKYREYNETHDRTEVMKWSANLFRKSFFQLAAQARPSYTTVNGRL
jgi:hypothetical protein